MLLKNARIRLRTAGLLTVLAIVGHGSDLSAQKKPGAKAARAELVRRCKHATALVDLNEQGSGSAFCVRSDGWFVTNRHVTGEQTTGDNVKLVLRPGEEGQRELTARIVRLSDNYDLALLQAGGVSDLAFLELGGSDELVETTPVTAFGYPFGKSLAFGEGYPSVSVNTGKVSALRRKAGKLDAVQIDASVNPGNSGGPVVDDDGKVIGVTVSGIFGAQVNFAIPVNHLVEFLDEPSLIVKSSRVKYADRHQPLDWKIELVEFRSVTAPATVALSLRPPDDEARKYAAERDGTSFVVRAPPLPPAAETSKLLAAVHVGGEVLRTELNDREVHLGGRSLRLAEVRRIERRPDAHIVTLLDGTKYAGSLIGLDDLTADGRPLDVVAMDRVEFYSDESGPAAFHYDAVAERDGQVVAAASGTVALEWAPRRWTGQLYDPADPYAPQVDEMVIDVFVDAAGELRIGPTGLRWVHHAGPKPAANGATATFSVNEHPWKLEWEKGEANTTQIYPLKIGLVEFDVFSITASAERGGSAIAGRGRTQSNQEEQLLKLAIDDPEPGGVWYRLPLVRRSYSARSALTVRYSNGQSRRYFLSRPGRVLAIGDPSWLQGALRPDGDHWLLDFGDGKLERLSLCGQRMFVEHWSAASEYPAGQPSVIGVATSADGLARVKTSLHATAAPAAAAKWERNGKYAVRYAGGALREYVFTTDGEVTEELDAAKPHGRMRLQGSDWLLDFNDGKIERLSPAGVRLFIEHFDPATTYPKEPPTLIGVATKVE